ncbi:DUF4241 domain-containing protein [Streptomyces hundungensis]|uniref:DUF4241 domain-containing protein n=1 Tax=Streptomyces hundungensis TaxID=1077946 RepID=UPI0033E90E10
MVIEVGYARAWDLEARVPWRPISVEEARERDLAGLPYVVVYRTAGREAPLEVRLVSWRDHHVGLLVYDVQGRRTYDVDMRLLDNQMRLLHRYTVCWKYTGPDMVEFDQACPRVAVELFPDGRSRLTQEPGGRLGGAHITVPEIRDDERWMERPAFGEWPLLSAQFHGVAETPVFEFAEEVAAPDDDSGNSPAPATCWRPPRPAQPGPMSELFRPGVCVTDGHHPEMTVVEPRRIGTLRVPSGLLAVSGPDTDHADGPHVTVPVTPGEYVLDEARARHAYHSTWEQSELTRTGTMAVRLLVSEVPPVSWEMALRPEDDPRLFIENQISGFITDGATGCFADAGAWEPLLALFEKVMAEAEPDLDPDVYEDINDSMYLLRTRDKVSGGELAAFATTGDGTYPVWVGRTEAGEVVAVVVLVEGMLEVLPDAVTTADAC